MNRIFQKPDVTFLPVKIKLVNGVNKSGILIDHNTRQESNTGLEFVCNSNISRFNQTENPQLVELIKIEDVLWMDKILK